MTERAAPPSNPTTIEFNGTAGEYFRIWIVNIALSIVTLGIYSAWATVRTKRYFYTQTFLKGDSFDFHASPKAILIGRIIAVAAFGAYLFSGSLYPLAPVIIILIIFAAVPWLVVRSRIFRLRNSSYRGIRFNFAENYGEAFKVYYLGALVTVFSLGLASPTALYWRNQFAVDNSAFGKTAFRFKGDMATFYSIIWKSIGLAVVGFLMFSLLVTAVGALFPAPDPASEMGTAEAIVQMLLSVAILTVYLAIGVYVQVRIRNYVWNNTTLGDNAFSSTLSASTLFGIYVTNIIAIVVTVGLMVPWAKVRVTKYRASQTTVLLADDWERYVAADQQAGSALGDEIGDAFDIGADIGI